MSLHCGNGRALCVCTLMICVSTAPVLADRAMPRVRPLGHRMVWLLERGYAAPHTLAALIDALERSDVIVHIEERWLLDRGRLGQTQLVAAAGGQRYLRIHLDPRIRRCGHSDAGP